MQTDIGEFRSSRAAVEAELMKLNIAIQNKADKVAVQEVTAAYGFLSLQSAASCMNSDVEIFLYCNTSECR